jgi:outer membrane protein OmpA-like peptidoglycan-associated protein
MTLDASGNVYFTYPNSGHNYINKIVSGGASAGTAVQLGNPTGYQPGGLITDSAGNVYVSGQDDNKIHKYNSSLTEVNSGGWPAAVGTFPGGTATDGTYIYVAYDGSSVGGISRVKLSDGSVTSAWATSSDINAGSPIAVGSDGTVYVAGGNLGSSSHPLFSITPGGTVSTLAALDFSPNAMAADANGNVYLAAGSNMPGSPTHGVYKVANATPTPTPTPSSDSSATTAGATTSSSGKPAPGPALKVANIPAEFTLDLGSSSSASGTLAPDQPITAEVPCTAPEGQLLDRCTVNVTAPEYVLLGQGDGIQIRSDKKVSIGKATVKAKSGKKTIVVKVTINGKGRKALQRNLKITATVGLTAVTVSNLKSTGDKETTMRLPTQLISPESGIFDSNSISLNKAGVAFVNRLAALLPKAPKDMVFIGFADNTGVPGDNRWLGDRRAKAVRDALAAKGIEPVKSSVETKAARSPRADNSKAAGRERNRRVSIRITY